MPVPKKILLLASLDNVRFKGGIYFIAHAYLNHREYFRENGYDLDALSTCQIKNRDINKVGGFYGQNIRNVFRVMRALYKTEKNTPHNVWYCLTSTGLGFVKDVTTLFVGNIFFKNPNKFLNIQFSQAEMVIPRKIWLRNLTKWMIRKSIDGILVQTQEMKNAVNQWIEKGNVTILYNFCVNKEGEAQPKARIDTEPLRLLYLSMMSRRKGFHLVLELMNMLKNENVELHVAGDYMDEEIREFTNNYIAENQLSSKVIFHGFVKGEEKEAIIEKSDVFVLLSEGEGMAMALLEAMNNGLALVISDIESNRIAASDDIPVFGATDLPKIQAYILNLLSDGDELLRQKKQSFQRSKQFSITSHINQLCDIFEK